ncbi:MAG TPA: hypothetical protein VF152_14660 [Acidimicrobiia bacterium]
MHQVPLRELCGYRAGDKGDIADVALFADDEEVYALIGREVTSERVKEHFGAMVTGAVERYEARNVLALNFVLHGALGGGGPRSLRADSLGKTLGGALVRLEIDVPAELASRRRPRPDVRWAEEILDRLPGPAGAT